MENERWMSVVEVADYLGVNKDTIRNWIKKDSIPAHRIGKFWRFRKLELDEWILSGQSAKIVGNNNEKI